MWCTGRTTKCLLRDSKTVLDKNHHGVRVSQLSLPHKPHTLCCRYHIAKFHAALQAKRVPGCGAYVSCLDETARWTPSPSVRLLQQDLKDLPIHLRSARLPGPLLVGSTQHPISGKTGMIISRSRMHVVYSITTSCSA